MKRFFARYRSAEPRFDLRSRSTPGQFRLIEDAKASMCTGAAIAHGGARAFYVPSADRIQMPPFESFRDACAYYATLIHELTHWTKHASRLNRDFGRKRFGDQGYAMEELVAELGAAFLCADLSLSPEPREEHASYIATWLKVLKQDRRAIFSAAAHAQRAADYLHGLQPSQHLEQAA
jgi:antirestriction protein ArdC